MKISEHNKEAIKEIGRLVLFGAISGGITTLINYFSALENPGAVAVIGLYLLRYADKYLHERSKKVKTRVSGLSPF